MTLYQTGDPIADHEILYRRVHMDQSERTEAGTIRLFTGAFRPNANDTEGLSLFLVDRYQGPENFIT